MSDLEIHNYQINNCSAMIENNILYFKQLALQLSFFSPVIITFWSSKNILIINYVTMWVVNCIAS